MIKLLVKSFDPSFNRLDFIKYIAQNTQKGLIESKNALDMMIDNYEVFFEVEDKNVQLFIKELSNLGVELEVMGNGSNK